MAARTPIVVGNWKLQKTIAEALALVTELKNQLGAVKGVAVGVAPPFTALHAVAKRLEGSSIATCGQDCFWENNGAFTGAISAPFLADAGASWAIVGHSERRQHFGDTSTTVGAKARAALAAGLGAIVCVGETLAERDAALTETVVGRQIDEVIESLGSDVARIVVAYEPVWAIGTGRTATPEQAQAVHALLRSRLAEAGAEGVALLYGGSVKAANAAALFAMKDVDGGLVGGASLDAGEFLAIGRA